MSTNNQYKLPSDVEKKLNDSMNQVVFATVKYIKSEISKEDRDKIYIEHGVKIATEQVTLLEWMLKLIPEICSQEDMHCDYSCSVCGGSKQFIDKFRSKVQAKLQEYKV